MAKKKATAAVAPKTSAKRRGGRKPGAWTLVQPEELRTWRERSKLSRGTIATMLAVSSTSVQNWETGRAVATPKMQQKIADLMNQPVESRRSRPARAANTNGSPPSAMVETNGNSTLIQATAAIVVEAIKASGRAAVAPKELGVLIRTVREALA